MCADIGAKKATQVDRQKLSPFLLRLFLSEGRHFSMSEYTNRKIPPKSSELQIYTWLDATLSELTGLIREFPEYRAKGTQFSFNVVFPDASSPNFRKRNIGVTIGGKKGPQDETTLAESRYQIGDYLDVAILPPGADISQANNQANKNSQSRPTGQRSGGDRVSGRR